MLLIRGNQDRIALMSTLYIIATPIGNTKDITLRSLELLRGLKIILCEDTRVTYKLLNELEIDSSNKKLLPYHEHNEREKLHKVLELLESGVDVALVSDAGMPLLNDPGFPLIREIRLMQRANPELNVTVEVLPGPTSITTALVASGFPTDKFSFLGYLPRKSNERIKLFNGLIDVSKVLKQTFVAFESPHRIEKTLDDMKIVFGNDLKVCICRELTKKHEEIIISKLGEFNQVPSKGEMVLVFNPNL